MNVYVDLETGTILNGPIVVLPVNLLPEDGASDSEVIEFAQAHGRPVV